ncbi:MAG TPA: STAS domain-containing protein [Bryobacteraceae bacterium]|nr:STAS domain-containing protein [Bryobacteraceae bacterium]
MAKTGNKLAEVLTSRESDITSQWLELQAKSWKNISASEQLETARKSRQFMESLKLAARDGKIENVSGPQWEPVRELLAEVSASRAKAGYTPIETASFVFSLKEALFNVLREEIVDDPAALAESIWQATTFIDKLGLFTMDSFQKSREDIISRQQQELLELSTPVVRLWENVLALPLIGTLDSARTQIVMQNLLDAIVATRSDYAIIDITGVPVVDTLVAQHLLKTVAAARLMGADCMISGIRPQIAQTIIHLGVDLSGVTTKATLSDAFAVALRRSGYTIVKDAKGAKNGREEKQTSAGAN